MLFSFSVWMQVSMADISISERVSFGVSSLAKSAAHAVWNRVLANTSKHTQLQL